MSSSSASSECRSNPSWAWVPSARTGSASSTTRSSRWPASQSPISQPSRPASAPSSNAEHGGSAATGLAARSPVAPWSSSTTASPPGPPLEPCARWRAPRARSRVVLAVPVAPVGWTARIGRDADECIAARHAGAVLADRPVLRRLLPDLRRRGGGVPGARPAEALARSRRISSCAPRPPVAGRGGRSDVGPVRWAAISPCPTGRPASWCSPTAAVAAATVPAIATSPPCSTRRASGHSSPTC